MSKLEELRSFILTGQELAEQGECLPINVIDILNEIEKLKKVDISNQRKLLISFKNHWNKNNDIGSEEIEIEDVDSYIKTTPN
jgi:hypothetical protein